MPKDSRIEQLKELVDQFSRNIDQYKSGSYDESNTRVDFIDKFFSLLGWDVANNQGFSETYRDVVREDKVKIDGSQKAPDYSFRIGGVRKFFVEAKKPSVNIKDDIVPAYQLRRYAYTAKLSLSILTDFEELAVYDTRYKPNKNDNASVARIRYFTYDQYADNFDYFYNTFSKEAILKGSFDKYAEETKNKKGTSEVDTELLALVEDWRVELAKNIAKNNPALSIYNLNTVVQKIIDRIIFIRIAEDRGIEDENLLLTVAKTKDIYEKLNLIFTKANVKYNAGLFAYQEWIEKVKIDDKVLSNIITNLYYPDCPYEFSVLPIEILGSIYERFLGKTIRFRGIKGDTHTAIVEEKPEVKKAGGVFYTPQYIVDYIVQNTVGEKIKEKTPDEISKIKIVDPACGSGSFLVGAYRYLLNYHFDYYMREKNKKAALKNGSIYEASLKTYKLSIPEKQRILTNNIYGVDIDGQAVEVTKLSLYLKLLEDEGKQAEGQLFKHSDLTLLPSLEDNIKCGNSLIGTDFYAQGTLDLTDEERIKVNCFDWEKEFPQIFISHRGFEPSNRRFAVREDTEERKGGFDVVIGNPPYVQTTNFSEIIQQYYKDKYSTVIDLYSLFIEKSLKLLKENNPLGFIVPSLFLKGVIYEKLRNLINEKCNNVIITEYGDNVFYKVKMPTCIIILTKGINTDKNNYFENSSIKYFNKVKVIKLGDISNITRGLEIGRDRLLAKGKRICLTGGNIGLYYKNKAEYIDSKTEKEFSKNKEIFKSPKIMIRETGNRFFATIDYDNSLTTRSIYNTRIKNDNYKPEFILGIINSKMYQFYFKQFIAPDTNIFPKIRIIQLKDVLIPVIDLSIKADKTKHDNIVSLVDKILELKKQEADEPNPKQKEMISRQIEGIDNAIDKAVYELYGLTDEEIKVVEE